LCWLWLCGAGSQAVCTVWKLPLFTSQIVTVIYFSNSNFHTVHTAYNPAPHNHSHHNQCRTPYAVVHGFVLLMMGIMMPETCWDRSLLINIRLVASCWFSLFTLRSIQLLCPVLYPSLQNLILITQVKRLLQMGLTDGTGEWNVCRWHWAVNL